RRDLVSPIGMGRGRRLNFPISTGWAAPKRSAPGYVGDATKDNFRLHTATRVFSTTILKALLRCHSTKRHTTTRKGTCSTIRTKPIFRFKPFENYQRLEHYPFRRAMRPSTS